MGNIHENKLQSWSKCSLGRDVRFNEILAGADVGRVVWQKFADILEVFATITMKVVVMDALTKT
jgi:hypothetical protein